MVTSRTVNNIIGKVLVMVARSRVFMYPVIYMSQYDVVKNALMGTHTPHTHTHARTHAHTHARTHTHTHTPV